MQHQIKKNLGVTRHGDDTEFRVWAPFAKNVTLLCPFLSVYDGSNNHPMQHEGRGYWSISLKSIEPGQTYKFMIDTGSDQLLRNDPRNRTVTSSDVGASVVVYDDYDWSDDHFAAPDKNKQIVYEMHIGTFYRPDPTIGGTFTDAIEKLPYLKNLGINMIELMPVTSMTYSEGWGYNVSDIYAIEPAYGGRRGLIDFVVAAHAHGIGVIVDVVYNHLMSSNLWRFDGWYEKNRGGIYFYNDFRGDTPWGSRPDYGRPEVRQFILDNVTMWLHEYNLDGLRLDSTIYMRNTEGHDNDPAHDIPEAWYLLQDIVELAHKINPDALMIAEDNASSAYLTKPRDGNGCGFDSQWEVGFPHALRKSLGVGETAVLPEIRSELERKYNDDAFERVIFSDSHDTAANGSQRLNEAASAGSATDLFAREKSLLAAAVTLTTPGIPMLLQGTEFLQKGSFNDWQALEWKNAEKYAGIVLAYRHLIDLRLDKHGNTAGLSGQSISVFHQDDTNRVIAYRRWDKGGARDDVLTVVNFGGEKHKNYELQLPIVGTWQIRFNSTWKGYSTDFHETIIDSITTDDLGNSTLPLSPYSVYILSQSSANI